MLVYCFVLFIVSNRYLLFWVSNGHNSVTIQNRTHVYMNFFHHKDLGNHLLQLCPKVVKHPVYQNEVFRFISSSFFVSSFLIKIMWIFVAPTWQNSPLRASGKKPCWNVDFFFSPSSDSPSRLDVTVLQALDGSDIQPTQYPNIYRWRHSVLLHSERERATWVCLCRT